MSVLSAMTEGVEAGGTGEGERDMPSLLLLVPTIPSPLPPRLGDRPHGNSVLRLNAAQLSHLTRRFSKPTGSPPSIL